MLITSDAQQYLDEELAKVTKRVQSRLLSYEGEAPSRLKQSFLLGKYAALHHPDAARRLTNEGLLLWYREKYKWTDEDEAQFKALEGMTNLWLGGLGDDLTGRVRKLILKVNEEWLAELTRRDSQGRLRKGLWDSLRGAFMNAFRKELGVVLVAFEWTVEKFMNSDLARVFQKGQASEIESDELVYKIPRPQACAYCMDLHVEPDGSPILYSLAEVEANSNIGMRAVEWEFTIGPVHPNCYCVLYTVSQSDEEELGPNEFLANSRREQMAVGLKRRKELLEQAQEKYEEAQARES